MLVMLFLKKYGMPHLFIPSLFQSQACESFFRQVRSMSTVYFTVTNCTIRDLIKKINRIELQSEIAILSDLEFPRIKKTHDADFENTYELPTEEEIVDQIEQCQHEAIQYAEKIGMIRGSEHTNKQNAETLCGVEPQITRVPAKDFESDDDGSDNNMTMGHSQILDSSMYSTSYVHSFITLALKNFATALGDEQVPEDSIYVEVFIGQVRKIVKKSSLVWLLRKDATKLSSDRLQRVRTRIPRGRKSHGLQRRRKKH